MSGDAEQMRAASDGVIYVTVVADDGAIEQVECKRLRPADLAEATDFIFKRRTDRHIGASNTTELAIENIRDMHARTLAMIQCGSVSVYDVVCDPMGRIKLCELAMNRAAGKSGKRWKFDEVKARLAHVDLDEFFFALCKLSGCYKITGEQAEDTAPLVETPEPTPTEPPSVPTTGTGE